MTRTNRFPKTYDKRASAGFTLLELLVVIAIIGIISSFAAIEILNPENKIKKAAWELMTDMQKTRMSAIKDNVRWAIVFIPASNEYSICSDPGADTDWSTIPGNTVIRTVSFTDYASGIQYGPAAGVPKVPDDAALPPDGVSYPNTNVLVFVPQGTCDPGWVYLTHGGISYAVGTLTTGIIRILRWNGGAWI